MALAAGLARYYEQKLSWYGCGGGMQCAQLRAPLDWSNPSGDSITLALIKHPATGAKRGSLLVNPGGPGAVGAAPIMIVGTTGDPATPYAEAKALAKQLDSGVLVTSHGEAHTAHNRGISCVDRTVDAYLLKGDCALEGPAVPLTRVHLLGFPAFSGFL